MALLLTITYIASLSLLTIMKHPREYILCLPPELTTME